MSEDDEKVKRKNRSAEIIRPDFRNKNLNRFSNTEYMEGIVGIDANKAYRQGYLPLGYSWILRDWAMRGEVTIVAGPGSQSKTTLVMALCVSMAFGVDFLNLGVNDTSRVMFATMEDEYADLYRKYIAIREHYDLDDDEGKFCYLANKTNELEGLTFDDHMGSEGNASVIDGFIHMVRRHSIDVLVLDPLVNLSSVDENSARSVAGLMYNVKRIAKETECSIILLTHTRKVNDTTQIGLADVRGSSALLNSARVGIVVRSPTELELGEADVDGMTDPTSLLAVDRVKNNFGLQNQSLLFQRRSQLVGAVDPDTNLLIEESIPVIVPVHLVKSGDIEDDLLNKIVAEFEREDHYYASKAGNNPRATDVIKKYVNVKSYGASKAILDGLITKGVLEKFEKRVPRKSDAKKKDPVLFVKASTQNDD